MCLTQAASIRTFVATEFRAFRESFSCHHLLLRAVTARLTCCLELGQVIKIVHELVVVYRLEVINAIESYDVDPLTLVPSALGILVHRDEGGAC